MYMYMQCHVMSKLYYGLVRMQKHRSGTGRKRLAGGTLPAARARRR